MYTSTIHILQECIYHCKKVWVTSTISWLPQLHSFCVGDIKVQGMLTICVVEKLPSFVKLVSPFRKPINQHFW